MMGEGAKANVMDFSFMGKKFANTSPTPWVCKKTMGRVCHELATSRFGFINSEGPLGWFQSWACGLAPRRAEP
jgi:hypothetical protein